MPFLEPSHQLFLYLVWYCLASIRQPNLHAQLTHQVFTRSVVKKQFWSSAKRKNSGIRSVNLRINLVFLYIQKWETDRKTCRRRRILYQQKYQEEANTRGFHVHCYWTEMQLLGPFQGKVTDENYFCNWRIVLQPRVLCIYNMTGGRFRCKPWWEQKLQ